VFVIVMGRIGQHLDKFGVAGGAAAVLRRAAALAVTAARLCLPGSEDLVVVGPAVAEVVELAEPGG
jgi:hypothetical protein